MGEFFHKPLLTKIYLQQLVFALKPSFFKILTIGQTPVKADCKRLSPTKAVTNNQYS